jgi:hypothetical protein
LVLVTVALTIPSVSVLMPVSEIPSAGLRALARNLAKSLDSDAEPPVVVNRLMAMLRPAPRPTPTSSTA